MISRSSKQVMSHIIKYWQVLNVEQEWILHSFFVFCEISNMCYEFSIFFFLEHTNKRKEWKLIDFFAIVRITWSKCGFYDILANAQYTQFNAEHMWDLCIYYCKFFIRLLSNWSILAFNIFLFIYDVIKITFRP